MTWKEQAWPLLKQTYTEWTEDKVTRLAASLAYYTVFSLAPMLVIAVMIVSVIYSDSDEARAKVTSQLQQLIGGAGAEATKQMLDASAQAGKGVLATIISVVILVFGATGVFGELQDSMNTIWDVQPRPNQGIWGVIRARFLSFTMVLGVAFLLLVSLLATAVVQAVMAHFSGSGGVLAVMLNTVVSFLVVTLMFAMIFKFLPDVKIQWADVWLGALITSALFTIGKFGLGIYLTHGSATGVFGAAGSLAALLIWVYYSAQILFAGAEFTQVYAKSRGRPFEPTANAIPVTDEARARQGIPTKEKLEEAARA